MFLDVKNHAYCVGRLCSLISCLLCSFWPSMAPPLPTPSSSLSASPLEKSPNQVIVRFISTLDFSFFIITYLKFISFHNEMQFMYGKVVLCNGI
jgi:hypothetical protein